MISIIIIVIPLNTHFSMQCAKIEIQPPPQQQWHLETHEMTHIVRGVGVKPPPSSINDYIIPSLYQEYDDPSMFDTNSLISEGSIMKPLVASRSQLSLLPPQQVRRIPEAPPMESLGALLISSKKKDFAKFFDQVSEKILSGCENYMITVKVWTCSI